jgi:hypothetical protein
LLQDRFFRVGSVIKVGPDVAGIEASGNQIKTAAAQADLPSALAGSSAQYMPSWTPAAATMQPSGNPIQNDRATKQAYLNRFATGWNPWRAPAGLGKMPVAQLKGGQKPFLPTGSLRGRRYIFVDEWGPYDFKSPRMWPRESTRLADGSTRIHFDILGPAGRYKVLKLEGARLVKGGVGTTGAVPGTLDVVAPATAGSMNVQLEYMGKATTDYRGIVTAGGRPVKFGYRKFVAPFAWKVSFFKWTEQQDPSNPISPPVESHIQQVLAGTPIKTITTDRLDFASGGSFVEGVPGDKFATVADGTFEVPAGRYVLELTTDDGARVWFDGKEVISDAWKYQGPTTYTADLNLSAGRHTIKVHHFEIGGYSALKVNLRPK